MGVRVVADFYQLLGVPSDADLAQIKKAFRRASRAMHPDLHKSIIDATGRQQLLNEAYETLNDPAKRRRYDEALGEWYAWSVPSQDPAASRPQHRDHEAEERARRERYEAAVRRRREETRHQEEVDARRYEEAAWQKYAEAKRATEPTEANDEPWWRDEDDVRRYSEDYVARRKWPLRLAVVVVGACVGVAAVYWAHVLISDRRGRVDAADESDETRREAARQAADKIAQEDRAREEERRRARVAELVREYEREWKRPTAAKKDRSAAARRHLMAVLEKRRFNFRCKLLEEQRVGHLFVVRVLEKHDAKCGGDPQLAPTIGSYEVDVRTLRVWSLHNGKRTLISRGRKRG